MNIELLITFIVLNIVNVIIQTVKSIATIKCGKYWAAAVNAIAYGLYTVVVVYTVCDLPLWLKVTIVALCNLVGVFTVKLIEEKSRKDKLWKVEATIPRAEASRLINYLENSKLSYNYVYINKYYLFNFSIGIFIVNMAITTFCLLVIMPICFPYFSSNLFTF